MDTSENITNAFAVVNQLYQESALLIKEVQSQLHNNGFIKLGSRNHINATNSNSLDNAKEWFTRYCVVHFIPKNCDAEIENYRLYFAIHFTSLEFISEPVVLAGVARKMDHEKAHYKFTWARSCIEPNQMKFFRISLDSDRINELEQPLFDGTLMYSYCQLKDDSYSWPKDAIHFAKPLLKFDSPEKVSDMVNGLVAIWKNKDRIPIFNTEVKILKDK